MCQARALFGRFGYDREQMRPERRADEGGGGASEDGRVLTPVPEPLVETSGDVRRLDSGGSQRFFQGSVRHLTSSPEETQVSRYREDEDDRLLAPFTSISVESLGGRDRQGERY